MSKRFTLVFILATGTACGQYRRAGAEVAGSAARVPVVYCTDLFHPHDDADDLYDIATLFALPELDVKAILLDLGDRQRERPGRIPAEMLMTLTGRNVPYATGLSKPLRSPDDKAIDRPSAEQASIELLIRTLREAPGPVVVITVGSSRDVCAAFNREPELLRTKISRLYINSGSVEEKGREWNVDLDVPSYVGLMRSGLPIYWCPCMPAGQNRSTNWTFKQGPILDAMPQGLLNYFVYTLQHVDPGEIAPEEALSMDLRPWRRLLGTMDRNMWSTQSLIHAAGRGLYRNGDRWVAAHEAPVSGFTPADVFAFVPVRVETDDKGGTSWKEDRSAGNMQMYTVTDKVNHAKALTSVLRELLSRFPVTAGRQSPEKGGST